MQWAYCIAEGLTRTPRSFQTRLALRPRRPARGKTMPANAHMLRPPSRTLMFLEGRAIHEFGAFLGALPLLSLAPRGDGHPVLVLPGLIATDNSTRPLRSFLRSKGYTVS